MEELLMGNMRHLYGNGNILYLDCINARFPIATVYYSAYEFTIQNLRKLKTVCPINAWLLLHGSCAMVMDQVFPFSQTHVQFSHGVQSSCLSSCQIFLLSETWSFISYVLSSAIHLKYFLFYFIQHV